MVNQKSPLAAIDSNVSQTHTFTLELNGCAGGPYVENSYFAASRDDGWSDLAFTVRGPVVGRIEAWFDELEDWVSQPKPLFRAIRRKVLEWDNGSGPVRLLIGGPTGRLSGWARCVSEDLVDGDRLDMVMAYFSPSPRLSQRIRRIGSKGQARLLFPAKSDHGATIRAARAYYARLLRAARIEWFGLTEADWLEAFSHHPRIGDRASLAVREAQGLCTCDFEELD